MELRNQFPHEKSAELLRKRGTHSITTAPIGNVLFAHLGKSLPSNLPSWCGQLPTDAARSAGLVWAKHGYDGIYNCDIKTGQIITDHPFMIHLILFTKGSSIKRLRWILAFRKDEKEFSDKDFEVLLREYVALGYEFAERYGLPTSEKYEVSQGYEDDLPNAFKRQRAVADRTYKASDGNVETALGYGEIKLDYVVAE